jgi:hypothetical protein
MNTLAHLAAALAALIHLYIYWLERHAYGSARFCRTFNIAERDLPALRAPFHNLALYNLMQALGVLTGIMLRLAGIAPGVATGLMLTPLATMSAAGIYLYITAADKRRPALIQALPPLLALAALAFAPL